MANNAKCELRAGDIVEVISAFKNEYNREFTAGMRLTVEDIDDDGDAEIRGFPGCEHISAWVSPAQWHNFNRLNQESAKRSSAEPSTTAAAPPVTENKASALAPASKIPGFANATTAAAATRPAVSTTASLAASLAGAPSTGPASTAAMQAALAAAGSGGHDPFMQYAAATQMRQMQQYQQMQYQMAIAQQAASRGAYGGSGFPGYDAAAAAAGWPFGAYPPYGGYGLDNAAAMAEQRQKMQAAMAAKAAAPPAKAKAATKANAQAKAKQQAKSAAAKPMQAKIMERSVPPGVVQQTAAPSKKNTTSPALAPQASPDFSLPSHPSVPAASTSDEKFLIPSAGAKGDDDEDDAGCAQS